MRKLTITLFTLLLLAACSGKANPNPIMSPTPTLHPEALAGKQVFEQRCSACHSTIPNTVIVGPTLAGIATNADSRVTGQDGRTYLYTSILEPGAFLVEDFDDLMPASLGKQLTGEELDAVVAYLLTLK